MAWWDIVISKLAPGDVLFTPGRGIPSVGRKPFKIIIKTSSQFTVASGKSKIPLEKLCFDAIEKEFHEKPYLWLRVASLHDNEPFENSVDKVIRHATGSKLARGNYVCS